MLEALTLRHPELVSGSYFGRSRIKMLKQVQHDGPWDEAANPIPLRASAPPREISLFWFTRRRGDAEKIL